MESYADLRQAPDQKQASFTAMLSRILTDAFLTEDTDCQMPAFLTDTGVSILRFAMEDMEAEVIPGADVTIGQIISRWQDAYSANPKEQTIVRSGRFALCAPFTTLQGLLDQMIPLDGGMLGFFDPIYEDSLILIHLKASSQAEWHLRLSDRMSSAA